LFPLLSGLFGASGLVFSFFSKVEIPVQRDTDVLRIRKLPLFFSVLVGILAGSIVTLFPGLGPSQAAALAQVRRMKSLRYLVLVGALGTVDVLISLVTLFVLNKSRNGAVVVIEQLLGNISYSALLSFIAVSCIAAGVATIAALFISRWYARLVERMNYSLISLSVFVFLLLMSFILSGWLGLLVFVAAAAIGLIAPLANVSRSHAMGCLLMPTLILLW
jgi:putative membrane protein